MKDDIVTVELRAEDLELIISVLSQGDDKERDLAYHLTSLLPEEEGDHAGDIAEDEDHDQFRSDVEADADALSSAGYGPDEDYEHDTPMGEEFGGE
jgi:hypothetical protein